MPKIVKELDPNVNVAQPSSLSEKSAINSEALDAKTLLNSSRSLCFAPSPSGLL